MWNPFSKPPVVTWITARGAEQVLGIPFADCNGVGLANIMPDKCVTRTSPNGNFKFDRNAIRKLANFRRSL